MTREKIIQGLYRGDSRAIKEAIKALEKEPCEDAISKASVFEILGNLMSIPHGFDRQINEKDVSESMDEIKALPSVTLARKKDGWIPCSERLPENNGVYLVTIIFDIDETESRRDMTKAYFCSQSKKWQYFSNDEVIAWMPLPEPYKAESEG